MTDEQAILSPVRRATVRDVNFAVHVARQWRRELGHIGRRALINRIEGRRGGGVYIGEYNDTEAGFLHHGTMKDECHLFQAGVAYDLQRRSVGLEMVKMFVDDCIEQGTVRLISLRCLADTDANAFWSAAGFKKLPAPERGRTGLLNVWHRWLPAAVQLPGVFVPKRRLHACPDCGKETYDTWSAGARRWATCPACTAKRIS
jgi:hypothetical protein